MQKNYFMKNVLAAMMLLALSMGMSSCTGLVDAVLGTSDNPTTQPTTQPTTSSAVVTADQTTITISSLEDMANAVSAEQNEQFLNAIKAKAAAGEEYTINIKSEQPLSTNSFEGLVIPRVEGSNINIVFDKPLVTTEASPLKITADEKKSNTSTDAVNELTITMPDGASDVYLNIDMPETTVKLEGKVTYQYVESVTATETLYVGSDVVIGELLLKGGCAVVANGGVIETYVWPAGETSVGYSRNNGITIDYNSDIAPYPGVVPAKYHNSMYSIRQEGEENTPYYCKKLKIVKGSSVSETKIAFRNTADKLFEKLIIDDGVKAICETPKPYVKEIEGVGNATFAATGDSEQRGPEPTYGSWGSLEYVESIKNVTIEGARPDDKEVEFSNLRNVPANTENVTFKISDIYLGTPNQTKEDIKNCKFVNEFSRHGLIQVYVPYQKENVSSYEFTFDNCEFSNTNIYASIEKTKLKKDQDGNQVYKDVYCWYKEEDDGHMVVTQIADDLDKVPEEIKSKGQHDQFLEIDQETGKFIYTEGYWVEQREAYEDVNFDNYYVYLVFNNCKYNGSALTSNTRFISEVEDFLPAGVYTRYVIDGKTYKYVWDKENRVGSLIEVN